MDIDEVQEHKRALDKIKSLDPEFYKYLKENDKKLLEFNVSDNENEESATDDEQSVGDSDGDEDGEHEEREEDENNSQDEDMDASDAETERSETLQNKKSGTNTNKVTLKQLDRWRSLLKNKRNNRVIIISVINAFHAAIVSINDIDESTRYNVSDPAIFNEVIKVCVTDLEPAFRQFLNLKRGSKKPPSKAKNFLKIKSATRIYLNDVITLIKSISSSDLICLLLKHVHSMIAYYVCFAKIKRPLIKLLIELWSSNDQLNVRILAFLCLLQILSKSKIALLTFALKQMYVSFVSNAKFANATNMPLVNFMRRSLIEVFAMDVNVSYNLVFLLIRQLCVYLRNAVTQKTKENLKVVYSWQFVNCLRLWANFIATCFDKQKIAELMYPLTQIIIGAIKLNPTSKYYPIRFHCVQILIDFSKNTNRFIPLLPFLLEILDNYNFNKKHKVMSKKATDFQYIVHLSKNQLEENGVKDAIIDSVYGLLLEYLANNSYSLAFPDLAFLCVIQLKKFVKNCKIPTYCKKMKHLVEKIEQNSKFVETKRNELSGSTLTDTKKITALEKRMKIERTPLLQFFDDFKNVKKASTF